MDDEFPAGSPWTFAGESSHTGDAAVTLVDGTSFVVCGRGGDIAPPGVQGLFMLDTRVVSEWSLRVNGRAVESLAMSPNGPFSATFVGRVRDPTVVDAPITVVQRRHVGRGMREDLEVRNHSAEEMPLRIELALASDFASLFDVKAGIAARSTGSLIDLGDSTMKLSPDETGSRRPVDAAIVRPDVVPDIVGDNAVSWDITVPAGQKWSTCLLVSLIAGGQHLDAAYRCGQPIDTAIPVNRLRQWRSDVSTVETDSTVLATAVERASEDLGALRIFDPDHPDRAVVAAGAPWFMTLFGRDSLFAGWMSMPLDQDLATGVLRELADRQGDRVDPATEEQPGRILHEVRFDSASSRMLGGSNIYYGTIDATPLFVMLVAELARWTGLTPAVEELIPAADRALAWVDEYGDRDGDGFVEYLRSDPNGLENQGWKDSWDGVRHLDGAVAEPPIALCEVQGYVYAALRGRAQLAESLGEGEAAVSRLDVRADELRRRFDEAFWVDEHGWYAIGLDGDKRKIGSLTSNIGHLLWTGIVPEHRVEQLAAHLSGTSMFTGWGLRTLSADSAGYNPLSYHCGSVWPHDTAVAVAGLARYGYDREAELITNGLLAASAHAGGRLPELFAGFARDDLAIPVPYPASCSPQAWAAASPLMLVRAMLGLEPDVLAGRVRLRPRLPEGIDVVVLRDVPLGGRRVSISVRDNHVEVAGLGDGLTLEVD